jgi:arginine decarboxylase
LESLKEVDIVIDVARQLRMAPLLGVRVKLTSQIGGKWQSSSGERSTFGLNTDQLLRVVEKLRAHDFWIVWCCNTHILVARCPM